MKKLLMILFGAALLVAPFAGDSDARGGRGRGSSGRTGISGKVGSRGKSGSAKEQQRMRELTRCEERDSLIDGKLRRRSR